MHQYKKNCLGWFLVSALAIAAIALGAVSLTKSNEALALAKTNAATMDQASMIVPPPAAGGPTEVVSDEEHDQAPRDPPNPPPSSPPTTANPTTSQPTYAPTETHPLNPEWFHENHEEFQELINNEQTDVTIDIDSWMLRNMFCGTQSMTQCFFESYCPNGKGGRPYKGGPLAITSISWENMNETQWAPIPVDGKKFEWLQIGKLSEDYGGSEDNNFEQCQTWEDLTKGASGSFEDVWGEDNQEWTLCCEFAPAEDTGESD